VCILALVGSILPLAACQQGFDLFAFEARGTDGAERVIGLRESPGAPADREGLLEASSQTRTTPVYRLTRPFTVDGEGLAFVVGYTSDIASVALTVFRNRGESLFTASLPPTDDHPFRFQVEVPPGARIWGFQLGADPGEGSLVLRSAGLEPLVHGFRFDAECLTLDGSIAVASTADGRLAARLSDDLRDRMKTERWQLDLEIPRGSASIRLSAPGSSSSVAASFAVADDGPRRVVLHEGSVAFLPRELRVSIDAAEDVPAVVSCVVSSVPDEAPIPTDPGLVLDWRRSAWRDPDAEVFAWSRMPGVLIFDTATYEVQERFFRRLAFFVEKPETAGTIPSLEDVEGRRSWNAHDYRAEDLARFFSLAAGGTLTPEESRLRDVLLASGIIRADGDGYAPGAGAVLSISRESSATLRELLMTHEAFHGVFFALPAYRDACRAAWEALGDDERAVWLGFLDLKGYNTADPYLVVNEFQAYLFQQERVEVPAFQAVTLQRVRAAFPALGPAVRRVGEEHPDSFLASFDALDRALASAGGPPGGRVLGVRRTTP
jgi:hypothetical protein